MRNIASDAGIKSGSIYFFYENKEKLFIEAFEHLLEKHEREMKRIFDNNKDKEVEVFLNSLISGILNYHKGDEVGTKVYISLLTSQIEDTKHVIQNYLAGFNKWLGESIKKIIEKKYGEATEEDIDFIIDQFALLGNGVFWGVNVYDDDILDRQIKIAHNLINRAITDLNSKYSINVF